MMSIIRESDATSGLFTKFIFNVKLWKKGRNKCKILTSFISFFICDCYKSCLFPITSCQLL